MTGTSFEIQPIPEASIAHRAIYVGDDRLILGAMSAEGAALILTEISGGNAASLEQIGLILPALADFDVTPSNGGLLVAVERHGGATSTVTMQPIGEAETPVLPEPTQQSDERRPRFVRGSTPELMVSEFGVRAHLLRTGDGAQRSLLCDPCADAIGLAAPGGFALVAKQEQSGAPMAGISAGTLSIDWPLNDEAPARALFSNEVVFDYDVALDGNGIIVAAVAEENVIVARVTLDGTETRIVDVSFPQGYEPFSPTLQVDAGKRTLAVLATAMEVTSGHNALMTIALP